ncbi:MAG: hypothetical protein ACRER2_18205 [Methylococcales bacterium]
MKTKIPLWINALQVMIILILSFQTFACYFKPELLYAGININGVVDQQAVYVLAGRNAMMAIVSIAVLLSQNPKYFVVAFLMNFLRELQDMFIVPMNSAADAPMPPVLNFLVFLLLFVIPELIALIKLYKISNQLDK